MTNKSAVHPESVKQEVCIDLPGEVVRCWRSSDHVKVILRKHRDVFFDLNIAPGSAYTVESLSDFYSPREKKLMRKASFRDGEQFHLWVGRKFKGNLTVKFGSTVLGNFDPSELDMKAYDGNPKTKPEPLMVILGRKEVPSSFMCKPGEPYEVPVTQELFKDNFNPKILNLKNHGTEFSYGNLFDRPEVKEYVVLTEALPHEIQPQVLKQLDDGLTVEGTNSQIFVPPKPREEKSDIYLAMEQIVSYVSESGMLNATLFKEGAGYMQENWRALDKLTMSVLIKKRVNGKYTVLFKGRQLSKIVSQALGGRNARFVHQRAALGSGKSAFLDGGFARTGASGYGGTKRILLTAAENFRGGMKIQVVGTIIDIIGDIEDVFYDEKGSKDISEFLGRAGVSLVKAGATAVIGSIIAAIVTAIFLTVTGVAAVPVAAGVVIAIAGYVVAATIVDFIDNQFDVKNRVANGVR